MYYYNQNNDKDDPSYNNEELNFDSNQLFGTSFQDNSLFNFEQNGDFVLTQFSSNQDFNFIKQETEEELEEYNNGTYKHQLPIKQEQPTEESKQEAILLSDPNFIRQQQLLLSENNTKHSNLSAMFSQQQQQQQKKKPSIPMSSSLPSSSTGIDHQRRFNELQARFRINYAKKPAKESTSPNRKLSLDTSTKSLLRVNSLTKKNVNNTPKSPIAIPSQQPTQTMMSTPSSFPSRTMPIQIQRVHRANSFQPFDMEQRQKRLDDQLTKVDFEDITVSELKEMLRQRGKPATGKKAVLLQRLQEEKDFILNAKANGISISNRYQPQSPTSEQNSLPNELANSPNMVGSLNRSIADMHIESPPPKAVKRFQPYSSPRQQMISSSVPTNGSLDMTMMMQDKKKHYAPFTSSALATPDREQMYPFQTMEWTDNLAVDAPVQGLMSNDELLSFLSSQQIYNTDDLNHQPDLSSVMFDDVHPHSMPNYHQFDNNQF